MVFELLHWVPNTIAAILLIYIVVLKPKKHYFLVGTAMAFFALLGLVGFFQQGNINWFEYSSHTVHAWIGSIAFVLSIVVYTYFNVLNLHKKKKYVKHRRTFVNMAKIAAVFATVALIAGIGLFYGAGQPVSAPTVQEPVTPTVIEPPVEMREVPPEKVLGYIPEEEGVITAQVVEEVTKVILPEVEATEFMGVSLVPIAEQGNNAIEGTQYLDHNAYRLVIAGLVENRTEFTYDELLMLPGYSEAVYMPCVEGWGFNAKWTGFRVTDVLDMAGVKSTGTYVMFYSADGYSTGMPLSYLRENNVLLAYGLNDVTLPADRGWPLQLVAKSKYGYKWAKWVTGIHMLNEEERGFWEKRGYNNDATVGGPAFG